MSKQVKKTKQSKQGLSSLLVFAKKYLWLFMILFFIVIYIFVLFNINSFLNKQPSQLMISGDLKTTTQPNINPLVVDKLKQLNNNSVSVHALFNQSRNNPFQ